MDRARLSELALAQRRRFCRGNVALAAVSR